MSRSAVTPWPCIVRPRLSMHAQEDADLCQRLFERGPAPEHLRTRHTKLALKGRMHGRVRQVHEHVAVTSGRRLEQVGDLRGTYIHFRLGELLRSSQARGRDLGCANGEALGLRLQGF